MQATPTPRPTPAASSPLSAEARRVLALHRRQAHRLAKATTAELCLFTLVGGGTRSLEVDTRFSRAEGAARVVHYAGRDGLPVPSAGAPTTFPAPWRYLFPLFDESDFAGCAERVLVARATGDLLCHRYVGAGQAAYLCVDDGRLVRLERATAKGEFDFAVDILTWTRHASGLLLPETYAAQFPVDYGQDYRRLDAHVVWRSVDLVPDEG